MSLWADVADGVSVKQYQFLKWRFKSNPNHKTLQNLVAMCLKQARPFRWSRCPTGGCP